MAVRTLTTEPQRTSGHRGAFASIPSGITAADIERFLRGLDREGLAARNVNSHRQALANVFKCACRAETFALAANPVRGADKRREDYTKPPDTFSAEQILALARVAREGRHTNGGRRCADRTIVIVAGMSAG